MSLSVKWFTLCLWFYCFRSFLTICFMDHDDDYRVVCEVSYFSRKLIVSNGSLESANKWLASGFMECKIKIYFILVQKNFETRSYEQIPLWPRMQDSCSWILFACYQKYSFSLNTMPFREPSMAGKKTKAVKKDFKCFSKIS